MTKQNGQIHNQVAELLSAYIDDEMTAEERSLVETHLATCTSCAQDLATLQQTVYLLGQLPQVAAPRPFTLREADIKLIRPARPAWWRLSWARGLAAAAAILVCVVVVAGVILGRGGIGGLPAAPAPVAMEALPAAEAPAEEKAAEQVVGMEAEITVEVEKEMENAAEPAAAPPPVPEEATAEFLIVEEAQEAPAPAEAEVAVAESEAVTADEGKTSPPLEEPARAASGAAVTTTATPASTPTAPVMPTAAPAATPTAPPTEVLGAAPSATPTLLDVDDLNLKIEPGVIRASGRLPLPEGRKLVVVLWREDQPIEWATLESQNLIVETDGQFFIELRAKAEVTDFDLFAVEPANYELRIRPVDPPAPVEVRIPFDTYGPPSPPPTNSP